MKKVEKKFVDTFLKEDGSMKTGGMAEKATSAYKKIEDSFVNTFLEKVEDNAPEQKNT